jgi:ABC-type uncharacterized transport system ATPase subunit
MPEPLIQVRELSKYFRTFHRREGIWGGLQNLFVREYKTVKAVDRVNLSIDRGEMVGYIGPNGAGKSTSIKMLTGILVPTSGEAIVNGFIPYRQRRQYVRTIGVVFGQRTQLWWDIAVVESFKLLRRIYEVSQKDFDARMEMFNQILGIRDYLHTPVRKLSLGERMRCDLAAALLQIHRCCFSMSRRLGSMSSQNITSASFCELSILNFTLLCCLPRMTLMTSRSFAGGSSSSITVRRSLTATCRC